MTGRRDTPVVLRCFAERRAVRRAFASCRSEYRAWEVNVNGLTRRSVRAQEGTFGVINLLAPRSEGFFAAWHPLLTWSQMRFDLLYEDGTPATLFRTFVTFCALYRHEALAAMHCL